uniref:Uncharacterized protein n=1 Tax=Acanthochromis polyacanthus TaxID=80966 RepID=A0A3Q1G095_9TELE
MAAQVLARLKYRDGQREEIIVKVDNHLTSLISGINQLNASVSQLLSELVERENTRGDCAQGELVRGEEHKEDSDEEDEPEDSPTSEPQPPTKRTKTCKI